VSVQQDSRITDNANEAKDNVKYLYTLDKFFGPLVKCNPVSILMPLAASVQTVSFTDNFCCGICCRHVSVCVCLSVCLSHAGIVSKRLNTGSRK